MHLHCWSPNHSFIDLIGETVVWWVIIGWRIATGTGNRTRAAATWTIGIGTPIITCKDKEEETWSNIDQPISNHHQISALWRSENFQRTYVHARVHVEQGRVFVTQSRAESPHTAQPRGFNQKNKHETIMIIQTPLRLVLFLKFLSFNR